MVRDLQGQTDRRKQLLCALIAKKENVSFFSHLNCVWLEGRLREESGFFNEKKVIKKYGMILIYLRNEVAHKIAI